MATERQKKAIDNLVENGGNVTKAMRDAGYSETTINSPSNLTQSEAYKEFQELAEIYLPNDLILGSLADDIEKKEGNRVQELTLATKIRGVVTEKKDITSGGERIVHMPAEVISRMDETTPETE